MKKSLYTRAVAVILPLFLAGCATTQSTPPAQASADGQTPLQKALAREATLSGTYNTAAGDGFFSAKVDGSSQPTVQSFEGVYQVTVPIGSELPAECFVYHSPLDAAATLSKLIDDPLADMPKTQILKIDAGTFGKMPFLYEEKLYITDKNVAGVLKAVVMPFESSLVACMHDTAGYREAFRQMAASFANSLELRDAARASLIHEEVLLWKLRDMTVGYTAIRAGNDADGDIRSTLETAMVLPRSTTETMAHDEYNVTYEQPDGSLINGHYAEAENGQLQVSLRLDSTEQGGYQVSGSFQGKEVNAPLESANVVHGPYFQHLEILRAAYPASGSPRAVQLDVYVPSASPLATIAMDVNPTGERVDGLPEYEMLFAGLKATALVDTQGQKSLAVKMGPVELQLTRAWINGSQAK